MAGVIDAIASVYKGTEAAECRFPVAAILADDRASGRNVFGHDAEVCIRFAP